MPSSGQFTNQHCCLSKILILRISHCVCFCILGNLNFNVFNFNLGYKQMLTYLS